MQLYNLPLNPSTAIIKTIYGNFTSPKAQELVLIKTKSIELYSISDQYLNLYPGASCSC
jgi:splicing factor 3B subunit 3